MNAIALLKKEHENIERELFELESIIESDEINYPNLVHTFRKLCSIWDVHELREEGIFQVMKKENVVVPVEKMTCGHADLREHMKGVRDAINSGSEFRVKKSFDEDLAVIIKKLREHIEMEDEILYTVALDEFSAEELREMAALIKL